VPVVCPALEGFPAVLPGGGDYMRTMKPARSFLSISGRFGFNCHCHIDGMTDLRLEAEIRGGGKREREVAWSKI